MTQELTESRLGIAGRQTPLSFWVISSKLIADCIQRASRDKQPKQVAESSFSFPAPRTFHLLSLPWPMPAMRVTKFRGLAAAVP